MKARKNNGFPWHSSFARFGSKAQFAVKILDHCQQRADYDDIVALCAPIVERLTANKVTEIIDDQLVDIIKRMSPVRLADSYGSGSS